MEYLGIEAVPLPGNHAVEQVVAVRPHPIQGRFRVGAIVTQQSHKVGKKHEGGFESLRNHLRCPRSKEGFHMPIISAADQDGHGGIQLSSARERP